MISTRIRSVRHRDVLINTQSSHKWWSALKSAVFSVSSSLSPLVDGGDELVCESDDTADLLSDHLDGKQYWESVDLPLTYGVSKIVPEGH